MNSRENSTAPPHVRTTLPQPSWQEAFPPANTPQSSRTNVRIKMQQLLEHSHSDHPRGVLSNGVSGNQSDVRQDSSYGSTKFLGVRGWAGDKKYPCPMSNVHALLEIIPRSFPLFCLCFCFRFFMRNIVLRRYCRSKSAIN